MQIFILLCWGNPFILVKWPSWFLVTLLAWKPVLSHFNIAIWAFFGLTFVWNFSLFTSNLSIPIYSKCVSWKLHVMLFYLQSFSLCLPIRVFSQFILDIIMDINGLKSTISFIFFMSYQHSHFSFSLIILLLLGLLLLHFVNFLSFSILLKL